MTRYELVLKFDGPDERQFGFHSAIFERQIKSFIAERLNYYVDFRKQQLEKIYNLEKIQLNVCREE